MPLTRAVFNDPIGFRILDSRFHEKLSIIAGNAILQRIAYGLYNLGLDIRRRGTAEPGIIAQKTMRRSWRPSAHGTRLGHEKR